VCVHKSGFCTKQTRTDIFKIRVRVTKEFLCTQTEVLKSHSSSSPKVDNPAFIHCKAVVRVRVVAKTLLMSFRKFIVHHTIDESSIFAPENHFKGAPIMPLFTRCNIGLWCPQNVFVKFQLKIPHS